MIHYYTNALGPTLSESHTFVAVCDNESDTIFMWDSFPEWRHYIKNHKNNSLPRVFVFSRDPSPNGLDLFVLSGLHDSVSKVTNFDDMMLLEGNKRHYLTAFLLNCVLPISIEVESMLDSFGKNESHKCVQGGTFIFGKPICKLCGKDLP